MNYQEITLPEPKDIHQTEDGQFFYEAKTTIPKGGRYYSVNGVPFDPLSLFVSISPVDAATSGATCMVRSVAWAKWSFWMTFEIVDRKHWLETGELKAWDEPLEIIYAFHGRSK